MTARTITCFKAYDLRGRLGAELDEDVAWRVGRAFAARPGARRVVVGRDGRDSSPALAAALMRGLLEGGVELHELRQVAPVGGCEQHRHSNTRLRWPGVCESGRRR